MTKGVSVQEVIASGDAGKIQQKLIGLLQDVEDGMGMPITIYCAQLCQAELQRQAVKSLEKSSNRLERLTWSLIVLTIILVFVAVPPAIEAYRHLPGR
jgi:CHASE3 domain sensor protein